MKCLIHICGIIAGTGLKTAHAIFPICVRWEITVAIVAIEMVKSLLAKNYIVKDMQNNRDHQ